MNEVLLRIIDNFKGAFFDFLWLAPVVLISLTVHEYAHGRVAYALGDPTAKNNGRLTFNPIKHLDPLGAVFMLVFRFGWAKPVPVNPMYFKNRKRDMSLVAAAGPLSNIALSFISLIIYKLLAIFFSAPDFVMDFFAGMVFLNAGLAVFNLLPISPLDGSKIFISILPDSTYYKILQYEKYSQIIVLLLLFTGFLSRPIGFLSQSIVRLLDSVSGSILNAAFFMFSKIIP